MDGWVVRNQTPCRLVLVGDQRTLDLAPLQIREVDYQPRELGPAEQQAFEDGALAWEPRPPREVREQWAALAVLLGAGASGWLGTAVWQGAWGQAAVAGTALLLSLVALGLLNRLRRSSGRWSWRRGTLTGSFNSWESARRVLQRALHTLLLVVVVAVGLAVPAAAVWYGTGLSGALEAARDAGGTGQREQELVARGLQVIMIALLVLMPALMYFWFDREKTETLLDRWLHHIFRFDHSLRTLRDVDAKHGRRLEEAYGTIASGVAVRSEQRARSRAPVVLAALLLALGWVLVLVNVGAGMEGSAPGERTLALFDVAQTPVSFAFLGAYVYALQVVLRGYVRGDLRPKTYNAISVRIVVAFVLAGVAQGVLPEDGAGKAVLLTTCFLAGIVPDTVLRRLRDVGGWQVQRGAPDELGDAWPLTEINGIDLYERTRLGEEGITNVQALAHCDVVALTLSTRIPFERVVHWVDQAVLHEHVCKRDRARLRRLGITTATALLEVASAEREELEEALPQLRVQLLLRALERAEWVPMMLAWRRQDQGTQPRELRYPRPLHDGLLGTGADSAAALDGALLDGAGAPAATALPPGVPPRQPRRRPSRAAVASS